MMGHAWLKHREALLAVVIILMIGAIGSRAPSFVSPGNLVEMFNDTAILIILALGQMMVLLTKGIDLSMAANLALTGMIVALLNAHYPGIPVVALLALATLLGLLMGMINGLLVWRLGIPAIVVTLGTMSIYRGIIFLLTDGGWVNSHQMSADFLSLPRSPLLGLPLLSWCAIAALLLVGYFLRYSRTGRALYTAGGNATAAYYTGINAATGMDALTHAIEAFVSVGAHPLTDANALEAIRLINLWLPKAVDDGHDLQAREQMAFGQYLAGMAFNSAGLGLVHALAHQPGATHNLPHGVCNAILLPIIENFNRPNAVARFARVAQAMGVDTRGMSDEAASMEAINAIRTLSKRVGIPQGFSQLGVRKADIEGWLDKALADPCAPCNPRPASRDEVRELYLEAL